MLNMTIMVLLVLSSLIYYFFLACLNNGKDSIKHHKFRRYKGSVFATQTILIAWQCRHACSINPQCAAATHSMDKCWLHQKYDPTSVTKSYIHQLYVKDCQLKGKTYEPNVISECLVLESYFLVHLWF